MRTLTTLLLVVLATGAQAAGPGYHLLKTIPVPGNGGWDYLTVDDAARRVYVSHGTEVVVSGRRLLRDQGDHHRAQGSTRHRGGPGSGPWLHQQRPGK